MGDTLNKVYSGVLAFKRANTVAYRGAGKDISRYLNARLTQDFKRLPPGDSTRALLLSPQGRIQGKMTILRNETDFLIVPDPLESQTAREDFLRALLQFKVSDDVTITEVTEGPITELIAADDKLFPQTIEATRVNFATETFRHTLIIGDGGAALPEGTPEEDEQLRIIELEPLWGKDLTEKIFGAEIPHQHLISYTKGCYTGQETVEMSTARGRPNRTMIGIVSDEAIEINASISTADNPEKNIGHVTSSASYSAKTIALGFIKTDTEPSAALLVDSKPANQIRSSAEFIELLKV